ncbi:metalloregulator ArsR/SmtB family transcription factor [Jeotgalibaca ciconiae]|uniref:ArsR family transcriptional regulator n=1 Tax=Jeotgalibaca ciconiae TaxID=2496265 RepID=A0A3S9HAU1_9LACT|nr:metalloregulator ArsR/SmtB family transcription factor [Jeotgalibaca ciconiae]AZP04431.1 ArsR family transcriptional regulator [Jeotgalibaca ciconiae]HJB24438.1 metalloregulator ArsR/SmtB family transcription factor [Candidatus Jeotgalibaca pullicola]
MEAERDVFTAIADVNRRKILRLLADVDEMPLHELTAHFEMGRTAVSKHLAILKEAKLVTSRKVGRETRYQLNPKPLREVRNWVSFYEDFWQGRLAQLAVLLEKQKMSTLEGKIMNADVILDFQYTSSIEQVWKALTESDILEQWILANDFKPVVGHTFQFKSEPNEYWDGIIDGEVLEVDEPHKLSYIWASAGETTTVVWTLTEVSEGKTDLHFEMTGFSEETKATPGAIDGAVYSWTEFAKKLKTVLEK